MAIHICTRVETTFHYDLFPGLNTDVWIECQILKRLRLQNGSPKPHTRRIKPIVAKCFSGGGVCDAAVCSALRILLPVASINLDLF